MIYLVIKGEVSNVYGTGGAEFSRRRPEDFPVVVDHRSAGHVATRVIIRPEQMRKQDFTIEISCLQLVHEFLIKPPGIQLFRCEDYY